MALRDSLNTIRTLVIEGHPLAKALNATVHPHQTYEAWSPLWDVLWEAQTERPHVTLHELDSLISRADLLALVDRAIASAR